MAVWEKKTEKERFGHDEREKGEHLFSPFSSPLLSPLSSLLSVRRSTRHHDDWIRLWRAITMANTSVKVRKNHPLQSKINLETLRLIVFIDWWKLAGKNVNWIADEFVNDHRHVWILLTGSMMSSNGRYAWVKQLNVTINRLGSQSENNQSARFLSAFTFVRSFFECLEEWWNHQSVLQTHIHRSQ